MVVIILHGDPEYAWHFHFQYVVKWIYFLVLGQTEHYIFLSWMFSPKLCVLKTKKKMEAF